MFLVFLVSSLFAWMVYVAYETVLPVSLVDTHGLQPAAWGFLLIVNPVLVTLFQLRLTRTVERVPAAPKLVAAMMLMGLPFLLFGLSAAIPIILVVLVLFVIGEMLWVPTSQSIVAGLAPDDLRGAYMGAFGSMGAAGFALAPFTALQVRAASGDDAMWAMFAGISLVSALLGIVACRGVGSGACLCCTGHVKKDGAAGDPRARASSCPRHRATGDSTQALAEDLAGSPLVGKPLPLRLRNFRPSADSYLASLGGPLPYMVRLREIDVQTTAHVVRLEAEWRALEAEEPDAGRFCATVARRGALLVVRRGERPDRAAQPLVSRRVAPAHGSADG